MDLSSSSKFITAREASALTGYVADYITRQCRAGKIDSKQVGRVWLIDEASLLSHFAGEAERKEKNAKELARQRELEYAEAKKKREEAVPVEAPVESPYAPVPAHPSWFTEEVPGRHLRGSFASLALTLTLLAGGLYAGLEETRSAGLAVVRETGLASVRTALHVATALRGDGTERIFVRETEEVREVEGEQHTLPVVAFELPELPHITPPKLIEAELAIEEKHHIDTAIVIGPVVGALAEFGAFIQDTTHAILGVHEEGTYAFVETAPEVPEKIVMAIHDLGYTIASLGNNAPSTSIAFVRSLEGEALGVVGNVALVYDTTKDTVARAYDLRVTAPEESRQYAVQEADSLKLVADSESESEPASVATSYKLQAKTSPSLQATSSVPSYIYGMAGAGASGALAGLERAAIFTYQTISRFFSRTSKAIASLFTEEAGVGMLCVKNSGGEDICITGDELQLLMAGVSAVHAEIGDGKETIETATEDPITREGAEDSEEKEPQEVGGEEGDSEGGESSDRGV